MRCRKDGLYRSIRSRWQRQRATHVEARTEKTVVGLIKKEKTHIVLKLLFASSWLQRVLSVAFATASEETVIDYFSCGAS